MKIIKVLHIAEIDDDISKGTSAIIPQYVNMQDKNNSIDVFFLNCNDNELSKITISKGYYNITDNLNMSVLKNIKPDIVVFHEIYKPYFLKIYKFLNHNNIPYMIIAHGGLTRQAQHKKMLKKFIANKLLFNKFLYGAKFIQYLSHKEKNNTMYKKIPSFIMGNGMMQIPTENFYLKSKRKNDYLNLVYVGRYDYQIKGLDELIKVGILLKQNNNSDVKINMYGLGNRRDENKIKSYIKMNNLNNFITVNGPIYDEEKRSVILENDAFIQVSRSEGQPLGVIEALCLGLPVILSEGTGYNDIIRKNNIGICTKTDAGLIYKAIIELKNNRNKLEYYSNNAYNYAICNYSWDKIVELSRKKYEEIIKKNR